MKRNIFFLILVLILVYIVNAATVSKIIEDAVIDQSGTVGTWDSDHSLSNITDGNYTTYAVTNVNNTYAMINFTKEDGSDSASKVQVTYNTSSDSTGTNYTLSDYPKCWSNDPDKLLFRLASNYTQNLSNNIIFENVTPIVMKIFNETIILLNDTAVALTNVNIIVNTLTAFNQSDGEALGVNNYTLDLTAGTLKLADTRYNNTAVGVNYTYSTPITLANIRVINSSVRLFNRTANLTSLNESGFTWLNNTNLTLANNPLTGLLRIYNCSGSSYEELANTNWTAYNADGKVFMTSNSTFANGQAVCINYSYWGIGYGEEVLDSNYSIDYLSGNLSILDSHWNLTLGINYTYFSDSTEKNKRECYNGSTWILLDTESDQDEIFDIRMFWSVPGSNWTIDYYRVEPDQYTTYTSATILFNITANLSIAPINVTTINGSLWTKINNASAPFTLNVSDQVLVNASYINTTVTFADGDRVWWYWSFRDNQSRSVLNTSIRMFDIDTDYQILSIGDGINFTMNTGDAVFSGDIIANSFIGELTGHLTTSTNVSGDMNISGSFKSAGLQGITMQLNATNCNLTITGGIITGYAGCSVS